MGVRNILYSGTGALHNKPEIFPFPKPLTPSELEWIRQQMLTNEYMHLGMEKDLSIALKMSDSLKLEVRFLFTNHKLTVETNARYTPGLVSGFDE